MNLPLQYTASAPNGQGFSGPVKPLSLPAACRPCKPFRRNSCRAGCPPAAGPPTITAMIDYDAHDWNQHLCDIKGSMVRQIIYRVLSCFLWSAAVVYVHEFHFPVGISD